MNVEQHPAFNDAMNATQVDRETEIGKHVWEAHMDQYGPSAYTMELAGIVGRLGAILWPAVSELGELSPRQIAKVLDLLKDLGNYTGFTYEWFVRNTNLVFEDGPSSEVVRAGDPIHTSIGPQHNHHSGHVCDVRCYDY